MEHVKRVLVFDCLGRNNALSLILKREMSQKSVGKIRHNDRQKNSGLFPL